MDALIDLIIAVRICQLLDTGKFISSLVLNADGQWLEVVFGVVNMIGNPIELSNIFKLHVHINFGFRI